MPKGMTSKPGNAPIKKVGQTASRKYGSDPSMQGPASRDKSRDLSPK